MEFLHLAGDPRVVTQRVAERRNHFMPASLVTSQLETLEPLEIDEAGRKFDFSEPVENIVAEFAETLPHRRDRM